MYDIDARTKCEQKCMLFCLYTVVDMTQRLLIYSFSLKLNKKKREI